MILFSLISSQYVSELPSVFNAKSTSYLNHNKRLLKQHRPVLAYSIKKIDFLFESQDNLSNNIFIDQNFWQNVLNTFWCRSFFLSTSNKMMNKYTTKLKSLNLKNNYKGQYKYLLSEFSSSLINNNIRSSLLKSNSSNNLSIQAVEYIRFKNFHFTKINNAIKLIKKNIIHSNDLKKNIDLSSMPLYVVSNHLGQMIIAEQPENLKWQSVFSSSKFYNLCEGWFFVNVEDAQEYLNYISRNYGLKIPNESLRIFTCNLQTFYKLLSNYNNKVSFRLVPDLNEVGNLINKYRYYSNLDFHKNQEYGKNYFKGQPIYLINGNYKDKFHEIYVKKKKYILLFTNYKTALDVWNKINTQKNLSFNQFGKLQTAKLTVYNLEQFLRSNINGNYINKNVSNFMLVPSKYSYHYTKNNNLCAENKVILNEAMTSFSYIKLWVKRIVWSLTSKKPID